MLARMTTESQPDISEAARMLARRGAAKGGRARANVLSAEERSEIASSGARARWHKAGQGLPYSLYSGTLQIGPLELECHVLNDLRRVFTQREVVKAISGGRDSGNLARYLQRNPAYSGTFKSGAPFDFLIPSNTVPATGYEATHLVEICDSYLAAREQGLLKDSQLKLALTAETIIRACAKVGIIALIDEATGYQKVRARQALQIKLQAFIADDMQEWARMFPEEFWLELARLEGIRYSPRNRPLRWGKYVMDFVYDAIDQDVGVELRKLNPDPHFLKNHHQWLKKYGREKVHDQIVQVVTIMKLCTDMGDFKRQFARVFEKGPLQLSFADLEWGSA